MSRDTATTKAKNKRIRQEAMREQLAAKGLERYVIDISKKLQEDAATLTTSEVQALKASAELRMKLVNKYLPDLKAVEVEGNISNKSHEEWLKDLE